MIDADELFDDDATPTKGPGRKKAASARRAPKPGNDALSERRLAKRIAAKTLAVADADKDVRHLAASVIGANDDTVDIVVAIMTADRGANTVLADVEALISAESEAHVAVAVALMPRPRAKALWTVLAGLDVVPATPPADEVKAALAVATAVTKIGDAQVKLLSAAADLIKKG